MTALKARNYLFIRVTGWECSLRMHEPLNYPVLIIFDKLLLVVRISYGLNRFSNDLKWIFRDFFIEFHSCIIPQKFEKSCPKEVYYCLLEDSTRFHQTIWQSFARFLQFSVGHFLETLFWLQNITFCKKLISNVSCIAIKMNKNV